MRSLEENDFKNSKYALHIFIYPYLLTVDKLIEITIPFLIGSISVSCFNADKYM